MGPKQIDREIDAVNGHVEQIARPGFVFVLPPRPTGFRPIQEPLTAKMPRRAERARLHQMLEIPHGRRKPVRERRHVDDAGIAGRRVHFAHLAGVQPQRFFAHDVLARLRRRHGHVFVREVRRGDHDGVDFFVRDDRIKIGRDFFDTPLFAPRVEQLRIGIACRDQLGARIEPNARNMVVIANFPGANNRHAHRSLGRSDGHEIVGGRRYAVGG